MTEPALTAAERARIHELFQRVRYAKFLGIELGEILRGQVTMHFEARPELRQVNDVLHGGSIASLIDTASAFAVITLLEPDQSATTSDLTIHFLRPVDSGRVTAIARVLRAGRRLLVVNVDVFSEAESLISTAVTSYIRLPAQS
jgi:acyl-CoA thioesterase